MTKSVPNIEIKAQNMLSNIKNGLRIPCDVKKGRTTTLSFMSVAKNGDITFTPLEPSQEHALRILIDGEDLHTSALSVQHHNRTSYRIIAPPIL
jgi:hypothetical protein